MPHIAPIQLHVNGLGIERVRLRRSPSGTEVIITDTVLGPFALTDDFEIEVMVPGDGGKWQKVDCTRLVVFLENARRRDDIRPTAEEESARPAPSWVTRSEVAEARIFAPTDHIEESLTKRSLRRSRRPFIAWEATLLRAQKALYAGRIPHCLFGGYLPVPDEAQSVELLVPDAAAGIKWLLSRGYKKDQTCPLTALDRLNGMPVRLIECEE